MGNLELFLELYIASVFCMIYIYIYGFDQQG